MGYAAVQRRRNIEACKQVKCQASCISAYEICRIWLHDDEHHNIWVYQNPLTRDLTASTVEVNSATAHIEDARPPLWQWDEVPCATPSQLDVLDTYG